MLRLLVKCGIGNITAPTPPTRALFIVDRGDAAATRLKRPYRNRARPRVRRPRDPGTARRVVAESARGFEPVGRSR
jgi:hypothetical protein